MRAGNLRSRRRVEPPLGLRGHAQAVFDQDATTAMILSFAQPLAIREVILQMKIRGDERVVCLASWAACA